MHGNPFFIFFEKLKLTKKTLISLNRLSRNVTSSVKLATDALHHSQILLQDNPQDVALIDSERICLKSLWQTLEMEEALMHQKSRVTWRATGDRNTNFFSNMVKSRWNTNKILSIKNEDGVLVHGQRDVELVATKYFQQLFNLTLLCYRIWISLLLNLLVLGRLLSSLFPSLMRKFAPPSNL